MGVHQDATISKNSRVLMFDLEDLPAGAHTCSVLDELRRDGQPCWCSAIHGHILHLRKEHDFSGSAHIQKTAIISLTISSNDTSDIVTLLAGAHTCSVLDEPPEMAMQVLDLIPHYEKNTTFPD